MAQNDINIKVQIDSTQAQNSSKSMSAQIRELTESMRKLEDAGKATSAEYLKLATQAAKLRDQQGDLRQTIKALADDHFKARAAMEGLSVGINVFSGLTQAAALFGVENEDLQKTLVKLQAAQNLANTAMNIAQSLNKDSYLMIAARLIKEKLLTTEIQNQTKAQLALNAAKKGAIGIIIALTTALAALAIKYASVRKEQDDLNKEINGAGVKALAAATVEVKTLDAEYNKLGDDLNAKKKFFEDHKEIMGDTAKDVKDIAEADKVWQEQTAGYIQAQAQRAKADAARKKATEYYEEAFQLEDYYERMKAGTLTMTEEVSLFFQKSMGVASATTVSLLARYNEVMKAGDELMQRASNYESTIEDLNSEDDSDTSKPDIWSIRAAKIKNEYLPQIDAAISANDKLKLQKEMQSKLIDVEIEKVNATAKSEEERKLQVYELLKAKKQIYEVAVATEEEEVDYNEIVDQTTQKQIEALKEFNQTRLDEQKKWNEFEKQEEEKAEKRRQDAYTRRLERERMYWQAAGELSSQFNTLVTSLQDAALANAEGNEKKTTEVRRRYAGMQFAAQIGSIAISTSKAIMEAWSAYGEIPFIGPALAAAQTAVILGISSAQTASANSARKKALSGKAARGAFVTGRSHAQGGELWELEGGEAVLNKRAMSIPAFRDLASAMNEATGGVSFSSKTMQGSSPVLAASVSDEAIAKIVAGIAAIPVVVTEKAITTAQRNVSVLEQRSRF